MLTGIRGKTIVKEGGKVEVFHPIYRLETRVEVIVLVEEDTTDKTRIKRSLVKANNR